MLKDSKIYIAGHRGLVGSAILENLRAKGYSGLVCRTSAELDLRNQQQVMDFFAEEKPEYVFLCAAKVGGIQANIADPSAFLYDNIMIHTNVIQGAYLCGVKKLLVLGSSCIYPRECPQPMREDYLMTGVLEPTNEGYALSKIVALKQAEYYYRQYGFKAIAVMPPNIYGTNDCFDLAKSHVMAALVKRFVEAEEERVPEVCLWGTGNARREFMHVRDLAEAAWFMMENYDKPEFINVGWGEDVSIRGLAGLIAELAGYTGKISWDPSRPDGMMRKCMDVSRMLETGFVPQIRLEEGLREMISFYRKKKKK